VARKVFRHKTIEPDHAPPAACLTTQTRQVSLSATPARTASQSDAFAQLLRGSLLPTVVAALVCIVVGLFSSPKAAWSAAFGAALVIFFFSLTLLVMKRTADLPPTTVMIVVMLTYTFKVIVLGVAMFLLRDVSWVSGYAVGLTITVCALVWLFFEMRAYKRLRIFAYDPDGAASLETTSREPRDEP
jgi:ATP synthase protein I